MRNTPGSTPRRQPPVGRYALILGVLILAGIFGVLYGARHQNPTPNPVSSPQAGASTAP
ncbi:MAG: hypothetical protein M3R53_08170 [Candidatus Eremiobacteraeota bacterium]|nr:hypothetical protein [Candidatus Eremiobacteraeota bacterium]